MKRQDLERQNAEIDRQIDNLVTKGYPELAQVTVRRFRKYLETLKDRVGDLAALNLDVEKGKLPFVIVIKSDWVTPQKAIDMVVHEGGGGFANMFPREPGDFMPIDSVNIPSGLAYLAVDIDRGGLYREVAPRAALERIRRRKRSPLTIEEGIAIITQYPEFLMKNHCFSLLASRCKGDRRVPAIWITPEKRARLGWCWDGNPHSWLGSASCGRRTGY